MSTPKCATCGKSLTGARTIIAAKWTCPACTYRHDYPEKDAEPFKHPRASSPIQTERLFRLPPVRRDG